MSQHMRPSSTLCCLLLSALSRQHHHQLHACSCHVRSAQRHGWPMQVRHTLSALISPTPPLPPAPCHSLGVKSVFFFFQGASSSGSFFLPSSSPHTLSAPHSPTPPLPLAALSHARRLIRLSLCRRHSSRPFHSLSGALGFSLSGSSLSGSLSFSPSLPPNPERCPQPHAAAAAARPVTRWAAYQALPLPPP